MAYEAFQKQADALPRYVARKRDGSINLSRTVRNLLREYTTLSPAEVRVMISLELGRSEEEIDAKVSIRQVKTAMFLCGMRSGRPARNFWVQPVKAMRQYYLDHGGIPSVDELVKHAAFAAFTAENYRTAAKEAHAPSWRRECERSYRQYVRLASDTLRLAGAVREGKEF